MKKITALLICFFAALVFFCPQTGQAQHTAKDISVLIDGAPVTFDVPPSVINGRTLVPFRALAEAINVNVSWNASAQTITAHNTDTNIRLQINNATAYRNDKQLTLDVPPIIINNRTLVPLRFFSEAFNCQVDFDKLNYLITITTSSPTPQHIYVSAFYALGDEQTSSWTDLFGRRYPQTADGNTDAVDELAFGWYSIDESGNLITDSSTGWQQPVGWQDVLKAAEKHQLQTAMVIHLTDGTGLLTNLLTNRDMWDDTVEQIAEEAEYYQGVNLDFEGLGLNNQGEELAAVKNNFTDFVGKLAAELKRNDIKLTLTLHAPNSAYRGYDYQALGQLADEIVIMAYDYGTKPEPENLVTDAVLTAKASVPAEKLLLGISAFNETADSLAAKIDLAKKHRLKGIALWRLGLISDEQWAVIKQS